MNTLQGTDPQSPVQKSQEGGVERVPGSRQGRGEGDQREHSPNTTFVGVGKRRRRKAGAGEGRQHCWRG